MAAQPFPDTTGDIDTYSDHRCPLNIGGRERSQPKSEFRFSTEVTRVRTCPWLRCTFITYRCLFTLRLLSVIAIGLIFTSTGVEQAPIYSKWNVVYHYRFPKSSLAGYFEPSQYNCLFYAL